MRPSVQLWLYLGICKLRMRALSGPVPLFAGLSVPLSSRHQIRLRGGLLQLYLCQGTLR